MATKFHGVERAEEIDVKQLRPDTRTPLAKAKQLFLTTDGVLMAMLGAPIIAILLIKVPFSSEILLASMLLFYSAYVNPGHNNPDKSSGRRIRYEFPFRIPFFAKLFDASIPGYKLGQGITFLGKEISTKLEVWSGDSDLRTHMLVLGTTGSGKTEFLLGLVYNALVQNSGFIYTDGKGDVALWNNVFRLARYVGREYDLVVINFLTSGRDFLDKQKDRTTNTMNPFSLGSSGMLIELIIALMDDSGGGGDMWKGRAIAFVAGVTKVLVFLRDRGYILLDAKTFIQYCDLPVLEKLVWDKTITEDGRDIKIDDPIFPKVLEQLKAYLMTLPGYNVTAKGDQEQKTTEQHGFITMQLTRLFGDLSFTYGFIFQTSLGEVDMYDVIINRRILVVLLPALERAPDSLKMLGKLIVGSIKQMMAGCLGNRLEGAVREIIESRPNNAKVPFYVVLDEYGYYAVLGFAVAPAQARSLGISITFAAQDFSSLQKASKEEADATWENTNLRVIGRLTSGKESETMRRVGGLAGEAQIHEISRKEFSGGAIMSGYRTVRDTAISKISRLSFDDLAAQENGEFTFFIGRKNKDGSGGVRLIRARTFYTASKEAPAHLRVNHFLRVEPPRAGSGDQDVQIIEALETALLKMLRSGHISTVFPDEPEALAKNNQPIALLQMGLFIREAQKSQMLSLGEATRVGLVAMDQEADIQQANTLRKIEEHKRAEARPAEDAALQESVDAVTGTDIDDGNSSNESNGMNSDDIPEIDIPDDTVIFASDDGLPETMGDGYAIEVVAGVADQSEAATDKDESEDAGGVAVAGKAKASGGSSGGSGTMAFTVEPVSKAELPTGTGAAEFVGANVAASPEAQQAAVPLLTHEASAEISDYLGDYNFMDAAVEAPKVPLSPMTSLLTGGMIGDGEETLSNEHALFIQNKITEVGIVAGQDGSVMEIRKGAEETVKSLERQTAYVDCVKPEPATLQGMDDHIKALLYAATAGTNDFN